MTSLVLTVLAACQDYDLHKQGEGDTPIKQVLALLKEKKSPIRAFIEYEHRGTGTSIEEVQKCMTYMRQALA